MQLLFYKDITPIKTARFTLTFFIIVSFIFWIDNKS